MSKHVRILIVEDSEPDAQLILRALRGGGIDPAYERVETREGMQAALHRTRWDVALSDHSMPQFDALGALELARRADADLPVIVISGAIGEELAVATMRAGAKDCFIKGQPT